MSKPKVYIDGKEGTTGLQIYDRLSVRDDIDLLLKTCVNGRSVYGGPARESVEKQIALIEEFVEARA